MDNLILTSLSLPDLQAEIATAVERSIEKHIGSFQKSPLPSEELLTRKEAAKLLDVSLGTLNEYTKKGIVIGYRIGACIRYKKSEILNNALNKIKTASLANQ
jgi:excisionase family DNA binding protein